MKKFCYFILLLFLAIVFSACVSRLNDLWTFEQSLSDSEETCDKVDHDVMKFQSFIKKQERERECTRKQIERANQR